MKTNRTILLVFVLAFVLRAGVAIYYNATEKANYWEYGAIAENLSTGKGYSLFYSDSTKVKYEYSNESKPHSSAYMMPGYPLFLALIFAMFGKSAIVIFLLQALISSFTAVLVYKTGLYLSNKTVALIAALIYALLPEMIYTTVSIGPTVFYHFFISLTLFLFIKYANGKLTLSMSAILGVILSVLIYLRPAIAMFIILLLVYMLYKKQFKQALIILFIVITFITPWAIRNYLVFNKFIPLTTTTGLNLYRGHNPYYPGFWEDVETEKEIARFADSPDFEVKMNDLYFKLAYKEIKEHPVKEIFTSFKKLGHLWLYYPYDTRAHNLLYLVPWSFLLLFFLFALFKHFDFEQKKYIYIYLLAVSLNAMVFFALLRYQTLMKIAIIPIAAEGIVIAWDFIKKKK